MSWNQSQRVSVEMIKHHYNKKQTFLGKLTVSWGWFELESKHRQTHQVNNICLSQLSALQTWKNSFMCCSLLFCSPFNQQTRDPKFESHWVTESFSSCLKRCKYFTRSQTFPVRHPSQKEPDPFETASILQNVSRYERPEFKGKCLVRMLFTLPSESDYRFCHVVISA